VNASSILSRKLNNIDGLRYPFSCPEVALFSHFPSARMTVATRFEAKRQNGNRTDFLDSLASFMYLAFSQRYRHPSPSASLLNDVRDGFVCMHDSAANRAILHA
jgi:hypothetical protein